MSRQCSARVGGRLIEMSGHPKNKADGTHIIIIHQCALCGRGLCRDYCRINNQILVRKGRVSTSGFNLMCVARVGLMRPRGVALFSSCGNVARIGCRACGTSVCHKLLQALTSSSAGEEQEHHYNYFHFCLNLDLGWKMGRNRVP